MMTSKEYEALKRKNAWRELKYRIEDHFDVDRVFRTVSDSEIPALHFKPEWEVIITPPFGGAMMRFVVRHNGRYVSVYCDFYENLGFHDGAPYWEMYPRTRLNDNGEHDEDTMRFNLADTDGLLKNIEQELNGEPAQ